MSLKSADDIAAAYDSAPWWYDLRGFFILTFAYNSTIAHQLRFFGRNVGSNHLEVACGTGTLLDLVLRWRKLRRLAHGGRIVGIDCAESMLAGARRRFAGNPRVELHQADATVLPYPDACFDTANIANAVHCLPDVDSALREVRRVLKPGGTLAANVLLYPRGVWPFGAIADRIDKWGIRKGILVTPYHLREIRGHFERSGFELTFEKVYGNCCDVLARRPS